MPAVAGSKKGKKNVEVKAAAVEGKEDSQVCHIRSRSIDCYGGGKVFMELHSTVHSILTVLVKLLVSRTSLPLANCLHCIIYWYS